MRHGRQPDAIAAAYPHVTAIGVDPSEDAISQGRELAAAAGLSNVTLVQDTRVPLDDGAADFVMAHGVLSWVSPSVRDAVIGRPSRVVRDGGLAFFSYNVDPDRCRACSPAGSADGSVQPGCDPAMPRGRTRHSSNGWATQPLARGSVSRSRRSRGSSAAT